MEAVFHRHFFRGHAFVVAVSLLWLSECSFVLYFFANPIIYHAICFSAYAKDYKQDLTGFGSKVINVFIGTDLMTYGSVPPMFSSLRCQNG